MQTGLERGKIQTTTADRVDDAALQGLLSRAFSRPKSEFLRRHADWWYRGPRNRLVINSDGHLAAYCGLIPTSSFVDSSKVPAWWLVDVLVAPEFRGRGLQSIQDRQVREVASLMLGFPNDLAARIHRKHGWGVREDLQVLAMVLRPSAIRRVRATPGIRGRALRASALLATPLAALFRVKLARYRPVTARREDTPSADVFADVFERYKRSGLATTYRDRDFIRWRYLDCPYRAQLRFFLAGPEPSPSHYLIARHLVIDGIKVTRILDIFGDFEDKAGLRDVLRLAIADAVSSGSSQITTLSSLARLRSLFRSLGFLLASQTRFCWYGEPATICDGLGGDAHWTLGDSDNDDPTYPL